MQFAISDGAVVLWIVALPDDCRLIPACSEMPVKRQFAAAFQVPSAYHLMCRSLASYDTSLTCVGFYPVYALALLGPELVRVINRGGIKHLVGFGVNMR